MYAEVLQFIRYRTKFKAVLFFKTKFSPNRIHTVFIHSMIHTFSYVTHLIVYKSWNYFFFQFLSFIFVCCFGVKHIDLNYSIKKYSIIFFFHSFLVQFIEKKHFFMRQKFWWRSRYNIGAHLLQKKSHMQLGLDHIEV